MTNPKGTLMTRAYSFLGSLLAILSIAAFLSITAFALVANHNLNRSEDTVRYLIGVVNSDRLVHSGIEQELARYQQIYGELPPP